MTIYGVYACENTYGGLHGVNNPFFIEGNLENARDALVEESYELIASWGLAEEYLGYDTEDDDYEVDSDELNEAYAELVAGSIYKISKECPYTIDELNDMAYNYFDELVEQYGTCVDW